MSEEIGSSKLVFKQSAGNSGSGLGEPKCICPNGHLSYDPIRIDLSDNWEMLATMNVCVYCLRDMLIKLPQARRVSE